MLQNINIEERIQAYLDGLCNEAERAEIAENINRLPAWKNTYEELQEIHQILRHDFEPMEPSMRFTKNVMEQIEGIKIAKPTRQYLNPIVIWMIGGTLAIMLLVLTGYSISLTDWSATESTATMKLPEVKMPVVHWGNYFNTNTTMLFLLINTVLGFALFDKWLRRGNRQTGKMV
jgi:anti-sigma factor RsiW